VRGCVGAEVRRCWGAWVLEVRGCWGAWVRGSAVRGPLRGRVCSKTQDVERRTQNQF
jgi:hypothetical protein